MGGYLQYPPNLTVKPLILMTELVKLVTPINGICLDPFAGSGTTLVACELEGFYSIGIDESEEFVNISNRRLKEVNKTN